MKEQRYGSDGEKWYALFNYNGQRRLVKEQYYNPNGEKTVAYSLYTVESPLEFKCRAKDDIAACEELAK